MSEPLVKYVFDATWPPGKRMPAPYVRAWQEDGDFVVLAWTSGIPEGEPDIDQLMAGDFGLHVAIEQAVHIAKRNAERWARLGQRKRGVA